MTLYVHVNEQNKPWIDMVSTEQKDGYTAVSGLMDYQKLALLNFPTKCFLDDNGVLHAPQDLPISEQQKNAQEVELLQSKVDSLNEDVKSLTAERDNVKADNANLNAQISAMQKQIVNYTMQLAKVTADLNKQNAKGGAE